MPFDFILLLQDMEERGALIPNPPLHILGNSFPAPNWFITMPFEAQTFFVPLQADGMLSMLLNPDSNLVCIR